MGSIDAPLLPSSLKGKVVILDVETDGLDPYHGARIFCWSYMTEAGEFGFMLKNERSVKWIAALFNDPTRKLVFHNAKFDLKMFSFEGIDIFGMKAEAHCTMILAKMYNGQLQAYDLRWLGIHFLNRDPGHKDEITDWLKANNNSFKKIHGRKPNFKDAPVEIVKHRALWDVETTLMLFAFFYKRVMAICPELYGTERQLMFVCIDMENIGVKVDITRAKQLKAEALKGIERIQKDLDALVCPLKIRYVVCPHKKCKKKKIKNPLLSDDVIPEYCPKCEGTIEIREETIETGFNSGSKAVQLPSAFEQMGFQLQFKTKPKKGKKGKKGSAGGRWSFDEYAMIRYVSKPLAYIMREAGEEGWSLDAWYTAVHGAVRDHKLNKRELLPPLVLKLGELSKMVSTYYDHLIEKSVNVEIEPSGREVGILHCRFNQSEAETGRFSSSDPNMQNMPRILGPRECFVPRNGRRNWHFDYEQVEMKFFVHFAKDKDMAKAISEDIHLYVAAEIYNRPKDKVSKEQRKRAKGVNFGIIYGAGAPTMAETLTKKGLLTTKEEAGVLVSNYHRRFPSVRRITNELKTDLHRKGYVTNEHGRRYYIPSKFGYKALNYLCQGTSADEMKRAMVKVWLWLRSKGFKSRILLTVHDELCVEIPRSEEKIVCPAIMKMMENLTSYFIPITVDAEVVVERWSKKEKPEKLGIKFDPSHN